MTLPNHYWYVFQGGRPVIFYHTKGEAMTWARLNGGGDVRYCRYIE